MVRCGGFHSCFRATFDGCHSVECNDPNPCYGTIFQNVPNNGQIKCSGVDWYNCYNIAIGKHPIVDGQGIKVSCDGEESCIGEGQITLGKGTLFCNGVADPSEDSPHPACSNMNVKSGAVICEDKKWRIGLWQENDNARACYL